MSNFKIIAILSLLFIGCLIVNTLPVKGDNVVVIPTRRVPTNSPVPLSNEGRRSVNDILRTTWKTWDPKHIKNPARRSREILALYKSFSDHFINIYTGISKSSHARIDSQISDLRSRLNRDTDSFISQQNLAAPYISKIQGSKAGLDAADYEAMSQIVENMFNHLQAYIKDLGY